MGHVIFALDTQVSIKRIVIVYGNLKDQLKLDLCICEVLSYTHGTMKREISSGCCIVTKPRGVEAACIVTCDRGRPLVRSYCEQRTRLRCFCV